MTDEIAGLRAEIRRLEAALAAAERTGGVRATCLAVASHEIREPMNGVLGMARLLQCTPLDEEQLGYVEALLESAEALLALLNDLLDLSRIDAGRLELATVDFELARFVERFRAMVEPRLRQKGLGFVVTIAPGTPELVRGDPGRLRQVLLNLVGNAIKFTEEGEVRLELAPAAAARGRLGLRLRVADTGIGMPPSVQERLFRPFEQGGAATARGYGGSGLGLVIARRLAEAMGGTIACRSREGVGTEFTVTLALDRPATRRARDERAAASLAGGTLLIVDPEPHTRDAMRRLAVLWGMTVRTVGSGGRALVLLQEAADRAAPFDVLLIDGTIPPAAGAAGAGSERGGRNLDAMALARRVRGDPRLAHASLVMLVASGLRGDAARALAAGFDAYLPKPVTAATLLQCLLQLRAPTRRPGAELITVHSMSERREPPARILVADDCAVNRRLARIVLERAGHEVATVGDGAAAIAALAATPFDLVLMDLQMPGMDGLEASARIRALDDPARAGVPIVAVTASALPGEAARCRACGMNDHLTKPLDGARLLAAVEQHRRTAAAPPAPRAPALRPRAASPETP